MAKMSEAEHEHWAQLWHQALRNVPPRKRGATSGAFGTVARLVGIPLYTVNGNYSAHNWVYTNWQRGSKPRDPKMVDRLQKLAGPHGKTLAKLKLKKLGIAHRYDFTS